MNDGLGSKKGKTQFNFYLTGVSGVVSPLDILNLQIYRREYIKNQYISHVNQPGGIRKHIKNSLIENLHIEGLENLSHLDKAIDFSILQSLSYGTSDDGNYSNKLHSLVIGPPASGKKFLIAIAKILNPIAFEISSTAGKLTPAGLIGRSHSSDGQMVSEPGYLPRASGGIVCIQDFHQVESNRKEILSIFTKVMEDGFVIDSTTAMTEHKAITALHIDTNLYSQVRPNKQVDPFSDLNVSMEVLSRFDFIIEIPSDAERPFILARELLDGKRDLATSNSETSDVTWTRDLRVIVAYLATYFRFAQWSDQIGKYAQKKLDLIKGNISSTSAADNLSKIWPRLAISVKKIAKTIACVNHRLKIVESDVDEAFSFVQYKLDYICRMSVCTDIESPLSSDDILIENRKDKILHILQKGPVATKYIIEEVNRWSQKELDRKTISRDLNALEEEGRIVSKKQGYWQLST